MNAIGDPISRVDGRRKVTGGARYTADISVPGAAHAAIVHSRIANGRTVSIDTTAAGRAPGVLVVLTHRNMPRMNPVLWSHLRPQGQTYLPLQDDEIHYAGQPVAVVVAETLDQAAYAGALIEIECEVDRPVVFRPQMARDAIEPPQRMWPLSSSIGDADKAIADAAVKIERAYTMADRHHNPMEPHATLAVWGDDGTLTLYDSTQMVVGTTNLASLVLGVPEEKTNVVCEFLGRAVGGKSWSWPHSLLAALAAKVVNRPIHARNGLSSLTGNGDYDPVEEVNGPKAIFSFPAVFAEVHIDLDLGLVRLNRFVGAYDAGRIINPKTVRSQAIGGIIWGVGQALLEQSETDPALGRFTNRNYSGYLVPTNADIPELDVSFMGEFDEEASPLGAKGLGELTAVSVAPAIANAVYHAPGKRIRDLPMTVEKLL